MSTLLFLPSFFMSYFGFLFNKILIISLFFLIHSSQIDIAKINTTPGNTEEFYEIGIQSKSRISYGNWANRYCTVFGTNTQRKVRHWVKCVKLAFIIFDVRYFCGFFSRCCFINISPNKNVNAENFHWSIKHRRRRARRKRRSQSLLVCSFGVFDAFHISIICM